MYRISIIIIVISILTACTNNNKTYYNDEFTLENDILNLISMELEKDFTQSFDLTITDIYFEESEYFSKFKVKSDEQLYEGIIYMHKEESGNLVKVEINYSRIDQNVALTHTISGGRLNDTSKRHYTVVSGVINDKRIRSIRISYIDNQDTLIKIGEDQTTYFDVRIGNNSGTKQIIGLDEEDNIVKSYEW